MTALTAPRGHTDRRDLGTILGIGAVVAATAVASWTNLTNLGEATSYALVHHRDAAFLLPLAVDGYAFMSARAWLTVGHSRQTRRWGFLSSLAALAISIAGNFGGHAVAAGAWAPGWVMSSLVATVASLVLFASVLLWTLTGRDRRAELDKQTARASRQADRTASRAAARVVSSPAAAPVAVGEDTRPAKGKAAATTHAAYERLHAAGQVNGQVNGKWPGATVQALAAETGKSHRQVRRDMATYIPGEN